MEHKEYTPRLETTYELLERLLRPSPEVVVVSGGPCGGKTTFLEELKKIAGTAERSLVVMPEVATHLMEQGVDFGYLARHDRLAYLDAQRRIIHTELDFIARAKKQYAGTDTLIVLDRGINDTFGYMTAEEARLLAAEHGKTPYSLGYDTTDKVIYLPSVAVRDPALYESLKATNATRYETASEAAATCRRTLCQWAEHPELHVVGGVAFADSLRRGVQLCLGGENEYEQKWELEASPAEALIAQKTDSGDMLSLTYLIQSYGDIAGLPIRLRRGYTQSGYEFFHFAIKHKTPHGNIELRRTISAEDYARLRRHTPEMLAKTRYAFMHHGQVWHADALQQPDQPRWFLEAEVAHPYDFAQLALPAENMHFSDVHTRTFATIMS